MDCWRHRVRVSTAFQLCSIKLPCVCESKPSTHHTQPEHWTEPTVYGPHELGFAILLSATPPCFTGITLPNQVLGLFISGTSWKIHWRCKGKQWQSVFTFKFFEFFTKVPACNFHKSWAVVSWPNSIHIKTPHWKSFLKLNFQVSVNSDLTTPMLRHCQSVTKILFPSNDISNTFTSVLSKVTLVIFGWSVFDRFQKSPVVCTCGHLNLTQRSVAHILLSCHIWLEIYIYI